MTPIPYPGLKPSNVNKDAKYSIRTGEDGEHEVQLLYRLNAKERALLSTQDHSELVEMVNEAKLHGNGSPGGAFYINEYLDVVVPTTDGECWFAGTYQNYLEFEFEGQLIGPRAHEDLSPGDPWPGPHVGIRYTLKAGGKDIGYTTSPRPKVERTELLSDHHGPEAAAELARRLAAVKGSEGGRIYINECGEFFSPPPDPREDFIYLGSLDEDLWFPPPDVPRP